MLAQRQTIVDEAIMNKQGYYHHHPQHRQRTKTANHPRNLFRLIWFAFEIDFDFNFDQEQMGLPPPLTVSQSLFLRFSVIFFLLITHTCPEYIHTPDEDCAHTHTNKAGSPQTF